MAGERTEFALRSAGERSVKVAEAPLEEHDSDVSALVATEPWLFEGAEEATSRRTSQGSTGGATGLEPAGVAGGDGSAYMRRWERIAGLSEDKED